jgi:hypothetical protein
VLILQSNSLLRLRPILGVCRVTWTIEVGHPSNY